MPCCVSAIDPGRICRSVTLARPIQHFGKIDDATLRSEKHVFRFQIAVNDAGLVRLLQRATYLRHHTDRSGWRHGPFRTDELRQVSPHQKNSLERSGFATHSAESAS